MDITKLVKIKTIQIGRETVHFGEEVRNFCKMPYNRHKKGCPNYDKNDLCPPKSRYLAGDIIIEYPYHYFYLIIGEFDIEKYKKMRLKIHPNWTDKQAGNSRHWQASVRKLISGYIHGIIVKNRYKNGTVLSIGKLGDDILIFSCGSGMIIYKEKRQSLESAGFHVFKTLHMNKISIERNPQKTILLVCMICSLNELNVKHDRTLDYYMR